MCRQEEPHPKEEEEPSLMDSPELMESKPSTDRSRDVHPVDSETVAVRCADITGPSRPRGETPPVPVDNNTPKLSNVEPRTASALVAPPRRPELNEKAEK